MWLSLGKADTVIQTCTPSFFLAIHNYSRKNVGNMKLGSLLSPILNKPETFWQENNIEIFSDAKRSIATSSNPKWLLQGIIWCVIGGLTYYGLGCQGTTSVHRAKDQHTSTTIPKRHIHTYIHTYIHTHIHTYIHKYIHTHIHTYIHTYTQVWIHKHVCVCVYE